MTAGEERKDKKYEIVWNKPKDFVDSVGFDHNGGWGKQALEVLKELFKSGDHWHSVWQRLYFRKMLVEQVSELLTEKNAQLVLLLARWHQADNLEEANRQDEEMGAMALEDRRMSIHNNNNVGMYISNS